MNGPDFVRLALQLALMLGGGLIGGAVMRRFSQPAVLGEMLGGIVLGPTLLGWLWPGAHELMVGGSDSVATVRSAVVQLGMLFFLLGVGLEIDLDGLKRSGLAALAIGLLGSLVPLAAGVGLVLAWPELWSIPAGVSRESYALFIGVCMANTANPVLARILAELGLLRQPVGGMVMAAALIDDLVGWSLLAIVLGDLDPAVSSAAPLVVGKVGAVILFFAVVAACGRFLLTPLLRGARRSLPWPTGSLSVAVIATLLAAAAAEQWGLHAFLGPLVLGAALSPSAEERRDMYDVLEQFALCFFVPLYFVSMGLSTNFATAFDPLLVLAVLLTACVSKIAACALAARCTGLDGRTALAVACGMNARGAMGVLLAGIGLENGVIEQPVYVALVVMAIVTSLAAGPLMQWFLPRRVT